MKFLRTPVILDQRPRFPDPRLAEGEGLVAIGGDLSTPRLLLAYRSGIFPWTVDPLTWWSPDPRAIFELEKIHVPRSLAKFIRKRPFEVTRDRAFRQVMQGCATPGPGRGSRGASRRSAIPLGSRQLPSAFGVGLTEVTPSRRPSG